MVLTEWMWIKGVYHVWYKGVAITQASSSNGWLDGWMEAVEQQTSDVENYQFALTSENGNWKCAAKSLQHYIKSWEETSGLEVENKSKNLKM